MYPAHAIQLSLQNGRRKLRWKAAEHELFIQQLSWHGTDWEAIQVRSSSVQHRPGFRAVVWETAASVNCALACHCSCQQAYQPGHEDCPCGLVPLSPAECKLIRFGVPSPAECKLFVQVVLPHRSVQALKHQSKKVDLELLQRVQQGTAPAAERDRLAAAGRSVVGTSVAHSLAMCEQVHLQGVPACSEGTRPSVSQARQVSHAVSRHPQQPGAFGAAGSRRHAQQHDASCQAGISPGARGHLSCRPQLQVQGSIRLRPGSSRLGLEQPFRRPGRWQTHAFLDNPLHEF